MVAFWIEAAAVGLISGILSGMFGIGGGIITTPAVRLLLGGSAIAAVASTLPPVILTSVTGAYSYTRARTADVGAGIQVGLWGALFAVLGAYLTRFTGGSILLVVTAVVIVYLAVEMALLAFRGGGTDAGGAAFGEDGAIRAQERHGRVLESTPLALASVGAAAGLYSGLLGLGGGLVIVPLLTRFFAFPTKRAIGTSLVAIAILSVPATLTHAILGHIDWRIAVALSVTVVPGALLGARITQAASERLVRAAFAGLLVVTGAVLAVNELAVLLS